MDLEPSAKSRPRKHRRRTRKAATVHLWDVRVHLNNRVLRLMWFSGLCFLATSILATHILSFGNYKGLTLQAGIGEAASSSREVPTLTIFTAPAPFEGSVGKRQEMAINSWLRLDPTAAVVLLGEHSSLYEFASTKFPSVTVNDDIDVTFTRKPLFHTIVERALVPSTGITMLVEPDVILLGPVVEALHRVYETGQDWLVTALPRVVSGFPFRLTEMGFESFGVEVVESEVEDYVKHYGIWDPCDGAPFWAWNANQNPLHAGIMPPFVYRQGKHNQWLLTEAIASNYRVLLDASQAFYVFRTQTSWNVTLGDSVISSLSPADDMDHVWKMGNAWFSERYGSYHFRPSNFSDVPLKLLACGGYQTEKHCLMNISKCPFSSCPLSSLAVKEMKASTPSIRKKVWPDLAGWIETRQGVTPSNGTEDNNTPHVFSWLGRVAGLRIEENVGINCADEPALSHQRAHCKDPKAVFPVPSDVEEFAPSFSLDSLVRQVTTDTKVVILAVVGNSYRDMLMSWVCRLKHLRIHNFLVSAIDDDIFHFATLQGLPVFRSRLDMDVSRNDCHFGTHCFTKVTKMKSRTVLQILRLGYHVLFSDVDVYWFKDPTEELMSYGPGHLPAQTDQWNETEALNEPRRLNSGFYFAWADKLTIAAFERIVAHGITSEKSEQPSFYDTLCGSEGEFAVGNDLCVQPDLNMTVHFLDPVRYPNGAYRTMWTKENVRAACVAQDCVVLHNNWIPGRQTKMTRQIGAGLWDYDSIKRMCLRPEE